MNKMRNLGKWIEIIKKETEILELKSSMNKWKLQ